MDVNENKMIQIKIQVITNAQMVRVPRNIINIKTNFNFPNYEDINFTLSTKWSDMARDYGNGIEHTMTKELMTI